MGTRRIAQLQYLLQLSSPTSENAQNANFAVTEFCEVRAWKDEHESGYHISTVTLSLPPLFYARRNMRNWSITKLVVEPTTIEMSLATFAPISGGKFA
jgi:hypothetical protein